MVCYNVDMRILDIVTSENELFNDADVVFADEMIKGVVDVERGLVAVDAELHADLERLLLENGSSQGNLWGVNFWKDAASDDDFVEFDSMINVRPRQNNRSRYVEDGETRQKIIDVVRKWIKK